MATRPRRLALLGAALLTTAAAGCGSTTTKTVTDTRTVTTTKTVTTAAAPEATGFCDSDAGDAITQAATDAQNAVNDGKGPALKHAVDTAIKAAASGTAGDQCIPDALNSIVSYINTTGIANIRDLDVKAQVKRIRSYEKKHKISRASPFD